MTYEEVNNTAFMLLTRSDDLVADGRYADAEQMTDAARAIMRLAALLPDHPARTSGVSP